MTLQDLGNIGDFVGGVGVVVTLAYLAVQIRSNTRALRSASHQSMLDAVNSLNVTLTDRPDFAALLVKAHSDFDGLTTEERIRFNAYASRLVGNYENVFYQNSQRLIDEPMWKAWDSTLGDLVTAPAFLRFWANEKGRYLPEFRDHVESRVPKAE